MAKFADHMEKIFNGVVEGYQKMEDGVVTGYKKIEGGVVKGFTGMVDKMSGVILDVEGNLKTGKVGEVVVGAYERAEAAFINTFVAKEGETAEEAKARITASTKAHQARIKTAQEDRGAAQKAMIQKNLEASCNKCKQKIMN